MFSRIRNIYRPNINVNLLLWHSNIVYNQERNLITLEKHIITDRKYFYDKLHSK